MNFWKKKPATDQATSNGRPLDDPRTRIKTTSAATATTNTAVQNSTIIDSNNKTVTYMSTRQTVTHTQQAFVTEKITRMTPSEAELQEFYKSLNGGASTTSTSTGVTLRSPLRANTEPKRSSTVVKMEETSVTQKQGRSVTQDVKITRVPATLNSNKTSWSSSFNSGPTNSKPSYSSAVSKPFVPDTGYVSPYANKINKLGTTNSTPVLSRPTATTYTFSTKPTTTAPTYTSRLTELKPISSLNSSSGAIPKRNATSANFIDAKGTLRPLTPILTKPRPVAPKKKLKPASVTIFNHERFDNKNNEIRKGSAQDARLLEDTFKKLGCTTDIITDAKLSKVKSTVQKLEMKNYADHSALVIVILSHGQRNDTIAAKDGEYKIDDDIMFPILRNRTLRDKPKIFFVQACKGARELGAFATDAIQPNGPPSEILKCYSTYEGYVSYRYEDGTPFIKILCENLIRQKYVDIASIMDDVRRLVKTYTGDTQIPSVTSTLTEKYVFGDYA